MSTLSQKSGLNHKIRVLSRQFSPNARIYPGDLVKLDKGRDSDGITGALKILALPKKRGRGSNTLRPSLYLMDMVNSDGPRWTIIFFLKYCENGKTEMVQNTGREEHTAFIPTHGRVITTYTGLPAVSVITIFYR